MRDEMSIFLPIVAFLAAPAQPTPASPILKGETELVISSPGPTDFKVTDEITNDSIGIFDNYWVLRDSKNFEAAFAMLSAQTQAQTTQSDWAIQQERSLAKIGADVQRQVMRITWYPDPPGAASKGLYTALDFISLTQNGGFRCGYIVLFKNGVSSARIARVDVTEIPAELMEGKLPRSDMRAQLPCYIGPDIQTAFGSTTQ
jgi:Protein of unknown function (DUF4019)